MVVFRKGGVLSYNNFRFYGDTKLEIVDVINYLGLTLSYTGKFSCTQRNIADMGLRAFYALKREAHELVNTSAPMLCRLFCCSGHFIGF